MMLGLLAGKTVTEPADAHDAGPFGREVPDRNRLMLMMLGLSAGKAQNTNQLRLMMLGLLAGKAQTETSWCS